MRERIKRMKGGTEGSVVMVVSLRHLNATSCNRASLKRTSRTEFLRIFLFRMDGFVPLLPDLQEPGIVSAATCMATLDPKSRCWLRGEHREVDHLRDGRPCARTSSSQLLAYIIAPRELHIRVDMQDTSLCRVDFLCHGRTQIARSAKSPAARPSCAGCGGAPRPRLLGIVGAVLVGKGAPSWALFVLLSTCPSESNTPHE